MIEEIILGVGPFENGTLIHNPTKGLEGKFSMEYCSCRALLDGKVNLRSFTDEQVSQPEVRSLIKRTKCVERYPMAVMGVDASGVNPQSVTIRMRDGTEYFRETPVSQGVAATPMTTEQFEDKYRDCASLALDDKEVEKSLSLLRNLEVLENIQELMKVVART
jgi:2-methylcitrate dehydratase PrpD